VNCLRLRGESFQTGGEFCEAEGKPRKPGEKLCRIGGELSIKTKEESNQRSEKNIASLE
jgi:hypothetical protein